MSTNTLHELYGAKLETQPIINDMHEVIITNSDLTTVDEVCRAFFTTTPKWLRVTLRLRNQLVGWMGFSAGDSKAPVVPDVIEVGTSFSVFKILDRTETEILMGSDDKHFSMRISVQRRDVPGAQPELSLATIAHHHDALGKVYISLVKFPHGPLARMCARRMAA